MKQNIKIAVIGGTGKSGKYLVKELIKRNFQFKILIRNLAHFQENTLLAEIVEGDVSNYEAVYSLLQGCQVVISTLGLGIPPSELTLFSKATTNVLQAMESLGIERYILITGLNVATPFDEKSSQTAFATEWMKTNYPVSTVNKQ